MEEKFFKRKISQDESVNNDDTTFSLLPFDSLENKGNLEEVPNLTLASTKEAIVDRMQQTNSIDELKDLTNLFGISLTKAEIIRASKESDLMDALLEQAKERITNNADYLPHDVLLDYLKTFQTSVDKSRKTFNDDVDKASVNISKTEINVNIDNNPMGLSRESREKVLDVMKNLFNNIKVEQENIKTPEEFNFVEEEKMRDDD